MVNCMNKFRFRGYLALLLLNTLKESELQAYAIIKRLRELTGHESLSPGVVYPIIRALESRGLIESRIREAEGRRVKVYALTEKGRRLLEERKSRVEEALTIANRFREMKSLGVERVFKALEALFNSVDRLDDRQKEEARKVFEYFEESIKRIVGGGK